MTVYTIRRILLESYPILVACALISIGAGYLLNAQIDVVKQLPLILMMIPPINGINNNVCSILGARLASALHIGMVEPKFLKNQRVLNGNINASWLMSIGAFLFTSAIFFVISYISGLGLAQSITLMLGFFVASTMAIAVTMLCTIALAFLSYARGLDPDNVVIPIVTSIGDVAGVMCLITVIKIIGV